MKALHKVRIILVTLALVSAGSQAASFTEADKDGDGALSLAEAQAAGLSDIAGNFKQLDTDKDGKLSKAELKANR
jgi:Ca2+-binding EF-hand superfamily protein